MSRNNSTREQAEAIQGGTSGTSQDIFESIQVSELRKRTENLSRQVVSTTLPRQGEQGSHDSPRDRLPTSGSVPNLGIMVTTNLAPTGVAAMFRTADPTPIEDLAGGACEMPRLSRGDDAKTIKKNKDASCKGLKTKYGLNSFQVTRSNQEDKDDDSSPAAQSTQDALISTNYKNSQAVIRLKSRDLHDSCMVPI